MLVLLFACAPETVPPVDTADTGTLVEPAPTPDARVGMAYDVVLSAGTMTAPASCDTLFDNYLDTAVRFTVDTLTETQIRFSTSAVDAEIAATPLEGSFTAPDFQTGPADLAVRAYDVDTMLYDTTWVGALADDGAEITGGRLDGLLDTTPISAALGSDEPGAACDVLASFGASCEACPDGAETCLVVTIEGLGGERVE